MGQCQVVRGVKMHRGAAIGVMALVMALGAAHSVQTAFAAPKKPAAKAGASVPSPAPAPQPTPAVAAKLPPCPANAAANPQKHIAAMSDRLHDMAMQAATAAALHAAIGQELQGAVDWGEMARLTLPTQWETLQPAQRLEFTQLLSKMVIHTYVKRFQAGTEVAVQQGSVQAMGDGRTKVTTTVTVKKTSAEVAYLLRKTEGCWRVSDIVVDEASQVQSYRQNFAKILTKEGWAGLIARMTKAANKKAS